MLPRITEKLIGRCMKAGALCSFPSFFAVHLLPGLYILYYECAHFFFLIMHHCFHSSSPGFLYFSCVFFSGLVTTIMEQEKLIPEV